MAKNQHTQTRKDRFGNDYAVIGCKDPKNTGFSRGYITIKGDTYKLEPSKADKEGVEAWIRVTKMNNAQKSSF